MAWYEGKITTDGAGTLKDILDTSLVLNDCWHIEDAGAGANVGVYHDYDPTSGAGSDFVVVIRDNQAAYADLELWEGWDSVGHAGTGLGITARGAYTLRLKKSYGNWGLAVSDHRLIWVMKSTFQASYIGQPARFNESYDTPLAICHSSYTGTTTYLGTPPLGYYDTDSTPWRWLKDETGANNNTAVNIWGRTDYYASFLTAAGTFALLETPVYGTTGKLIGVLEGAVNGRGRCYGQGNGEEAYVNGVKWIFLQGMTSYSYPTWCAVREA